MNSWRSDKETLGQQKWPERKTVARKLFSCDLQSRLNWNQQSKDLPREINTKGGVGAKGKIALFFKKNYMSSVSEETNDGLFYLIITGRHLDGL